MARPKKQLTDAEAVKMRDVEAYTHDDKKRTNNPPVGMAQHDKAEEKVKTYQFDPHLDPTLQWAGKAEGMSFDVPTSSIHIHESIKPHSIIARVMKEYSNALEGQVEGQQSMFEAETPAERMRRRREAHHAWRKNPENKAKLTKEQKEAEQQATIWISGLDRIHKTRGILSCYDFSATPFAPSGKKNDEEALFGWIVSDFGLNDGIESGLVKTPRVVVRDDGTPDAESFRSKLYHIYADETVKDDINRAADPEEPLPDLLTQAYYLLGKDWQALYYAWKDAGADVPPVMITVANRTETAARIKYAFDHGRIPVPELCDPNLTIHIDSKTMDAATNVVAPTADEDSEAKISKADAAAILRETVDTVGQKGKRGEQIRNVISVGMLSEGWDAKTVTHILGLRAFSSQLLCEQVVGRGLRRTSYDLAEGSDMFTPEYVNIFGIPFNFLPHESDEQGTPPTTPPKTQVEALKERSEYEIRWPNIIRLDRVFKPQLTVDLDKIDTLELNAADTRLRADLAPIIDGKTDLTKCTEIDLQKLDAELRMQRIVFEASGQVYDLMKTSWQNEATKFALLGQVIRLVEEYLKSGAIVINPPLFNTDNILGDKAEAFYTKLLKKYSFPEIDGENFITENVVWYRIAHDGYKMRWYKKPIYMCEYREDGLTHQGNTLFTRNPIGYALSVRERCEYRSATVKEKMLAAYYYHEDVKNSMPVRVAIRTLGFPRWFSIGVYAQEINVKIHRLLRRISRKRGRA